jgi:hypothetical protein
MCFARAPHFWQKPQNPKKGPKTPKMAKKHGKNISKTAFPGLFQKVDLLRHLAPKNDRMPGNFLCSAPKTRVNQSLIRRHTPHPIDPLFGGSPGSPFWWEGVLTGRDLLPPKRIPPPQGPEGGGSWILGWRVLDLGGGPFLEGGGDPFPGRWVPIP